MGERLVAGNAAIALLANTVATGAALVALILSFISISGAHFNPAVTLSLAWQGDLPWREGPLYIVAKFVGALIGVAVAHLMFGLPLFSPSQHVRAGGAQIRETVRNEWRHFVESVIRSESGYRRSIKATKMLTPENTYKSVMRCGCGEHTCDFVEQDSMQQQLDQLVPRICLSA
ncbi:MAG: aquaporin [Pyrinomonadaceae bacterium]